MPRKGNAKRKHGDEPSLKVPKHGPVLHLPFRLSVPDLMGAAQSNMDTQGSESNM